MKIENYGKGGLRVEYKTVKDCKTYCDSEITCTGFDYDLIKLVCFVFRRKVVILSKTTSVDHYDKVKCDVVPQKTTFYPNGWLIYIYI